MFVGVHLLHSLVKVRIKRLAGGFDRNNLMPAQGRVNLFDDHPDSLEQLVDIFRCFGRRKCPVEIVECRQEIAGKRQCLIEPQFVGLFLRALAIVLQLGLSAEIEIVIRVSFRSGRFQLLAKRGIRRLRVRFSGGRFAVGRTVRVGAESIVGSIVVRCPF